jgi:hypothetical protein
VSRPLLRDCAAAFAGLAIMTLFGALGSSLGGYLAPPRLDLDVALQLLTLLGWLISALAGFVVVRLGSMRAFWIFAVVEIVFMIIGVIQLRELFTPSFLIFKHLTLLFCALLGAILSNRLASSRIRQSPSD